MAEGSESLRISAEAMKSFLCRFLLTTALLGFSVPVTLSEDPRCSGLGTSDPSFECFPGTMYTGVVIIPTGDIVWEVGKLNSVSCVVDPDLGISADSLKFKWGGNSTPKVEICDHYINATIIETDQGINSLTCSVSGYSCYKGIRIGYPPLDVQNLTCVAPNWQSLHCEWDIPQNFAQVASENYRPYLLKENSTEPIACNDAGRRTKSSHKTCIWNEDYDPTSRHVTVRFLTSNALGNGNFSHNVNNFMIVLPHPPENLTSVEKSPLIVTLAWQTPFPLGDFPPGLVYVVEHRGVEAQTPWSAVILGRYSGDTKGEVQVEVDYPWLTYDFQVRLRSGARNVTARDETWDDEWWSEPAVTSLMTEAAVPNSAPLVAVGSFLQESGEFLQVTAVWAPLPRALHSGPNLRYVVTCSYLDSLIVRYVTVKQPWVDFENLTVGESYRVTIRAENDVGKSNLTSEILVVKDSPSTPILPVVILHKDSGEYELRWNQKPHLSYTIYACKGKVLTDCESDLHWRTIGQASAANVTLEELNMTAGSSEEVRFAVSAESESRGSSGMAWDRCFPPRPYNEQRAPPRVEIAGAEERSADIRWTLECVDRAGVVLLLEASWCEGHSVCLGPSHNKTENNTFSAVISLDDLRPGANYSVRLRVLYRSGFSLWSSPVLFTTKSQDPAGLSPGLIAMIASASIVAALVLAVVGRLLTRKALVLWKEKSGPIVLPMMEEIDVPKAQQTDYPTKSIATIIRDMEERTLNSTSKYPVIDDHNHQSRPSETGEGHRDEPLGTQVNTDIGNNDSGSSGQKTDLYTPRLALKGNEASQEASKTRKDTASEGYVKVHELSSQNGKESDSSPPSSGDECDGAHPLIRPPKDCAVQDTQPSYQPPAYVRLQDSASLQTAGESVLHSADDISPTTL